MSPPEGSMFTAFRAVSRQIRNSCACFFPLATCRSPLESDSAYCRSVFPVRRAAFTQSTRSVLSAGNAGEFWTPGYILPASQNAGAVLSGYVDDFSTVVPCSVSD